MKKALLVILTVLTINFGYSQNNQAPNISDIIKEFNSVEKKSISTKYFLNRGFLNSEFLADYQEFKKHKEDNFILNNKSLWKKIYRGLRKSYVGKNQKIKRIDFKALRDKYKPLKDVVPLGIIQVKGEWLKPYEVDENIKAKKEGYTLEKKYKKLNVFNGSVLKKKVYSGNVKFKIAPEAFYIKNTNAVKSISIDVSDGKGYRNIRLGDVITAKYTSVGEKSIGIKFNLTNKSFISYSSINVITLNEETPDRIFNLSSTETGKSSSTAKAALSGGTAALYGGCDGVFDRPVIIVEGYDAINEVSLADVRAKYTGGGIENAFRTNGHDVIYLNFSRGGNDIRTNASVLEQLIRDVNRQKIGNQDLIVIGESMGA